MNNLFIVGTPLQLLNAIEAAEHFKLENNILVIVHRSLEANRAQIDAVRSLYEWKEIIDIEYSKNSSILKYVDVVRHLKKHVYKYIFIPKLEVVPKLIIPNVIKEKVFLLDDGIMTVSIYENSIKAGKLNKYNFKEIRFLFFGLKIKIKDKINLFTYFDLKPIDGIEVVKNELKFLKKTYLEGADIDSSSIYFLGHPSSKYIDDDKYIESLHKLIDNSNKKIIYIPHRGESKAMKDILNSIDNPLFRIMDINMPVELYFLENKIYPSQVVAYYSTALVTLNIIYKDCKISFIPIPLDKDINNTLENVYKVFNKEGLGRLNTA
ncbi:MAG: polysialyltransferase family glycosyltransferase [Campylobacterota bacterium]